MTKLDASNDQESRDAGQALRVRSLCLRRNVCYVAALAFGLAALAVIGAAIMGSSFARYAGQMLLMISLCAVSLIAARACGKSIN